MPTILVPQSPPPPVYVRLEAAAEMIGVSAATLRTWCSRPPTWAGGEKPPMVKLGSVALFPVTGMLDFVERHGRKVA